MAACEERKVKLESELEALTLKLSQVSMEPRPITSKDQACGCHLKTIDQLKEVNMSLQKKMQPTDLFHECTIGEHPYGSTDKEGIKIKAEALCDTHVSGNKFDKYSTSYLHDIFTHNHELKDLFELLIKTIKKGNFFNSKWTDSKILEFARGIICCAS
jgi:hypothetical protein